MDTQAGSEPHLWMVRPNILVIPSEARDLVGHGAVHCREVPIIDGHAAPGASDQAVAA